MTQGDEFMSIGARMDDHQTFGREFTWRIAPGYRIKQTATTVKASYGTAFKAPSLYDLFDAFSGNPAISPEKSKGYDAGFEQDVFGDKVTFGATWFSTSISELIGSGPAPTYKSLNIGQATMQGIESFAKWRPTDRWTLSSNYTYTLAMDELNGTSLVRRPKHQGHVDADWRYTDELSFGAAARFVGKRSDYDLSFSKAQLPSFTTFGLYANYKVNEHATLYGRVDNLLDKRYEEVYSYGTSGRAIYAGVKTSF